MARINLRPIWSRPLDGGRGAEATWPHWIFSVVGTQRSRYQHYWLVDQFRSPAFQPFIPFYLETLKADIPEIGIVYIGIAIASNLMSVPDGILADKIGRKTMIVAGNQTLMANVTTAEERSSVIGFISMAAGLGSIVAPFIGSELWVLFNPRIPFLVSVAVAAAVVLPLAMIQESRFESTVV